MANKNILVSSNGKYEPISASVDDVTGVLSSSLSVTASTSSFVAQSGLMQIYGGKLMPVGNTSIVNVPSDGIYGGSVLTYNNSEGFAPSRASLASFGGDISGDTISGVRVRSVSNVIGGILPVTYGGTGTGSFDIHSLVTTSGSGLAPTTPNKIVVAASSNYISGDTALLNFSISNNPLVYLYTGNAGSQNASGTGFTGASNTVVWTKPSNIRFVRVICQGGGGGGSGGAAWTAPSKAGSGGAGGGYCDVVFNAMFLPANITISAGGGGGGGGWVNNDFNQRGGTGGNSYFGNYIISYGGPGGGATATNTSNGIGYSLFGGVGGAGSNGAFAGGVAPQVIIATGGASGGGGGGTGITTSTWYTGGAGGNIVATNANNTTINGGAGGATEYAAGSNGNTFKLFDFKQFYFNGVLQTNNFPSLISTGGGGGAGGRNNSSSGAIAGNGGWASYGAGGGGGGARRPSTSGAVVRCGWGGNGGVGYVLIICY